MSDKIEMAGRFFASLQQSERLPSLSMARYQAPLMERLCRHACLETDFYADRLSVLFDDGDARSGRFMMENWRAVPVFDRQEAQQCNDALHARTTPAIMSPIKEMQTSGSTGRPMMFRRTEMSEIAGIAQFERILEWHAFDRSSSLAMIRYDKTLATVTVRRSTGWNLADRNSEFLELSKTEDSRAWVDWLQRIAPRNLIAAPSVIEGVLSELARRGRTITLDRVLTTSETPSESLSHRVQAAFSAKLVDTYGTREVGQIATPCAHSGQAKHVSAETVLVEVLNQDGTETAPGETGAIVVTPFYSYGTPLIRYDTGDLAVQGERGCACGRTLPLLRHVLGRNNTLFRARDGSQRFAAGAGLHEIGRHISFLQIQMVQTEYDRIEVLYVPDPHGELADFRGATALMQAALHAPDLAIDYIAVQRIERSAGGKFEEFISRVPSRP